MTPTQFFFKMLRKGYATLFGRYVPPREPRVEDSLAANRLIYNVLAEGKPAMVARFGAFELLAVYNYICVKAGWKGHLWSYISGRSAEWFWHETLCRQMQSNAGFFPPTGEMLSRFGELMLTDAGQIDVLGAWRPEEYYMKPYMKADIPRVQLLLLEPFFSPEPWTRVLRGKRVLVVHPFARLIEKQYREKRTLLFANPDVLPPFELQTIQAVQSLGGEGGKFANWFEALESMEAEMDKRTYDIALIACGAYGMPLAAHAKRTGHQAVHLGGSLQLLFGIKGRRWESPKHGAKTFGRGAYLTLMNEHWVRPGAENTPKAAAKVEGACYW